MAVKIVKVHMIKDVWIVIREDTLTPYAVLDTKQQAQAFAEHLHEGCGKTRRFRVDSVPNIKAELVEERDHNVSAAAQTPAD